jgi:hypothetical protein
LGTSDNPQYHGITSTLTISFSKSIPSKKAKDNDEPGKNDFETPASRSIHSILYSARNIHSGVPQLVQENEILKSMLTNLSEFQLYNEKFMR